MDTNNGRARRILAEELIVAVQAAIADHPAAIEFEANWTGNLAAFNHGDFVGWIDMRALDGDPVDRWHPSTGGLNADPSGA